MCNKDEDKLQFRESKVQNNKMKKNAESHEGETQVEPHSDSEVD